MSVEKKGENGRSSEADPPKAEAIAYDIFPSYIGPKDVVIEVGANVGASTILLSELASMVHAFEPNPVVFKELEKLTAGRNNVQPHNMGAGAKSEMVKFNVPHPEMTTRGSRFVIEGGAYVGQIDVSIVALDDVQFPVAPTVLVLDCEGSELAVLEGANRLLRGGGVHTILAELHYLADGTNTIGPTTAALTKLGYRTKSISAPDGSPWVIGVLGDTGNN